MTETKQDVPKSLTSTIKVLIAPFLVYAIAMFLYAMMNSSEATPSPLLFSIFLGLPALFFTYFGFQGITKREGGWHSFYGFACGIAGIAFTIIVFWNSI